MKNASSKKIMLFTNSCIIVSCLLLILTYFLPVEALWKPFDAWKGYLEPSTGRFVQSISTSLFEVFPYGVGLIVLLGLVFYKLPTISILKVIVYSISWASIGIYSVLEIAKDELYNFPKLWAILGFTIIIPMLLSLVYIGWKFPRRKACQTYMILLVVCSLLQQICEIAWYLLEDGLLLNIGSVTGITSVTTLLICLVIRNFIISDTKESTE